jgi:nitrate reductase gamma subunit
MGFVTTVYALLFYIAILIFFVGLGRKIFQYWTTPAPLKVPTTPAPLTAGGATIRVLREVVLFESLFRSNKWIWLFGWMFHMALWLVLFRHLRYFIDPNFIAPLWYLIAVAQPFGKYAALAMLLGLAGLLARRILVERIRYISNPSDYLMLVLLLVIGGSGAMMTFVTHTDVVQLKAFLIGLRYFSWQPLPADFWLIVHLTAVISLMIVFPFSKLLHAPGVFFSPSRNQADNPREQRHLAPWAAKLETNN